MAQIKFSKLKNSTEKTLLRKRLYSHILILLSCKNTIKITEYNDVVNCISHSRVSMR